MKICPQCRKTYSDDTLNFCLDDGTALNHQAASNEPPPTIMMSPPHESMRNMAPGITENQNEVPTAPRYDVSPPKKSRAWLWVLGILLGLTVLCSGSFIGLIALMPAEGSDKESTPVSKRKVEDTPSTGSDSRKLVEEANFDEWTITEGPYLKAEKENGALVLRSVDKYYYTILADEFETNEATTLLTVKNISGEKASAGFGLVVHSDPNAVLDRDYALLIRSDNGTYRIVQHVKKKEIALVNWTKSSAIKRGDAKNDLEMRSDGNSMEFFINGESVKKLKDYTDSKDGVAGVYVSDSIRIEFSKLELRK